MTDRYEAHLHRMTFETDVTPDEPEYRGSLSGTFMVNPGQQIVDVDWSVHGEVTITFLIPGRRF